MNLKGEEKNVSEKLILLHKKRNLPLFFINIFLLCDISEYVLNFFSTINFKIRIYLKINDF